MEKIDRYYLEITSINNLKGKDKPSDKTSIELVDNKNYEFAFIGDSFTEATPIEYEDSFVGLF